MIEGLDADVEGVEAATERRDEVVAQVTEHASEVARELSLLQGGDYGKESFDTDRGMWTMKYEAGTVQYLRFEGGGTETYVVSTKQQPEPAKLAAAMADYAAFVEAFADHVRSLDGVLDEVRTEFPPVESTEEIVGKRDQILNRIRECANQMAGKLHRVDGSNYGTFEARVDGGRWELKWEDGQAQYLRVGGEGGIYLLSQYEPPSPTDLRRYVGEVSGFVDAFNDHVEEISTELSTVTL